MILEYNYDNGNLVLDLFKKAALATLEIKTVTDCDDTRFVMEYTLIEDYPELRQEMIRQALSESLNERLQLSNVLNQFMENAILDNVKAFYLNFNAVKVRKCQIRYSSSYGTNAKAAAPKSNIVNLEQCLEQFDRIVIDMGAGAQTVPGIFKREGSGRNKKYVPLTISDLAAALRHALTEE
jgi:hypothetical protein